MHSHSLPPHNDFKKKFYADIMPKFYGIGASVVILGAMFKLLNWPGGAFMLGVGLFTEAIIFLLSAFEPKEKELDWTKAYPGLLEGYEGGAATSARSHASGPIGEKIDDMFAQAKIDSALIERLGQGMHRLSDSVANMAAMPNLAAATEKYTVNVEKASETLERMHEAQAGALSAINGLANASQETQGYHEQVQNITETLGALNSAYKQELQETNLRSKTTHEVYTRIAESMEKMQAASEETERFETALAQLSGKLDSLNDIYGNMLSALKN